jgi:hypothetical protein
MNAALAVGRCAPASGGFNDAHKASKSTPQTILLVMAVPSSMVAGVIQRVVLYQDDAR